MGLVERKTVQRVELLMKDLGVGAATGLSWPTPRGPRGSQERGKGNKGISAARRSSFTTAPS